MRPCFRRTTARCDAPSPRIGKFAQRAQAVAAFRPRPGHSIRDRHRRTRAGRARRRLRIACRDRGGEWRRRGSAFSQAPSSPASGVECPPRQAGVGPGAFAGELRTPPAGPATCGCLAGRCRRGRDCLIPLWTLLSAGRRPRRRRSWPSSRRPGWIRGRRRSATAIADASLPRSRRPCEGECGRAGRA